MDKKDELQLKNNLQKYKILLENLSEMVPESLEEYNKIKLLTNEYKLKISNIKIALEI
jgi:hypothetical protein